MSLTGDQLKINGSEAQAGIITCDSLRWYTWAFPSFKRISIVILNAAPKALHESVQIGLKESQILEIDLSQYFADNEGDPLTYSYVIDDEDTNYI